MIVIVNSLPETLKHFEQELVETLSRSGHKCQIVHEAGDGQQGAIQKLSVAAKIIIGRFRTRQHTRIVCWPLFGFFDSLLWILNTKSLTYIIIHDPTPLRSQVGMSRMGAYALRFAVRSGRIQILTLTELASSRLRERTGVDSVVVPHPIIRAHDSVDAEPGRRVVRVLGQYKPTRDISCLSEIYSVSQSEPTVLEMYGRGWPEVTGWKLTESFIDESIFTKLVSTSDCIVIPYSQFYQSGVAVRALENGIPVVGPRHEHLEFLYGRDWPGLVDEKTSWAAAMKRVRGVRSEQILQRRNITETSTVNSWTRLLSSRMGSASS